MLQPKLLLPHPFHQGLDSGMTLLIADTRFIRAKKRKRTEPIPRNAFPHVVEKVGSISFYFCRPF